MNLDDIPSGSLSVIDTKFCSMRNGAFQTRRRDLSGGAPGVSFPAFCRRLSGRN